MQLQYYDSAKYQCNELMTMKISFRIQPTHLFCLVACLWDHFHLCGIILQQPGSHVACYCEIISHLCGIILQQPQWQADQWRQIAGPMVLRQSRTTASSWNCFLQTPHGRTWRSLCQLGGGKMLQAYSNLASWLLRVESLTSMTSKWSRIHSTFLMTSRSGKH